MLMDKFIKEGNKLLVHCHAGLGRTAVIIGCYLIYARKARDHSEAVTLCRKGRPGCFHKKYNYKFLEGYQKYLEDLRLFFPTTK